MSKRIRRYSPPKIIKRGIFRGKNMSKSGQRIELYSLAFKLALAQIPPDQIRERPDISLRIHASIRRQLKEGALDAPTIAFTSLKDVVVPDTP
jgi:hypothetical protein